jgi:hypothetical protein
MTRLEYLNCRLERGLQSAIKPGGLQFELVCQMSLSVAHAAPALSLSSRGAALGPWAARLACAKKCQTGTLTFR